MLSRVTQILGQINGSRSYFIIRQGILIKDRYHHLVALGLEGENFIPAWFFTPFLMHFCFLLIVSNFNDSIWILTSGQGYHIGECFGISGEKCRHRLHVQSHRLFLELIISVISNMNLVKKKQAEQTGAFKMI